MSEIQFLPSPNYEPRRVGAKPEMIIIHHTGTQNAQEAAQVYLNQTEDKEAGRISPHYMIDKDGNIARFVDEENRAWHAGLSYWRGERDINSCSIGIELVNGGSENGYDPYPDEQMDSLAVLCRDIINRHNISPENVLGHSDIAPGRKTDPGRLFDWKWLAAQGVGLWPEEIDGKLGSVHKALLDIGYDPETPFNVLLTTFQLHYAQEALYLPIREGVEITRRRMAGLIKEIS